MTTINSNNTYSGAHYSLTGNRANTTSQPANVNNLAEILNSYGNNNANGSDVVDLSPQAQQVLANLKSGGGNDSTTTDSNFVLTKQQQQQLKDIIAKYKDAPFTQETYNQLQDDLEAAGLAPTQLAAEDQIRSFNPTTVLLNAMYGTDNSADVSTVPSAEEEQTKSDNYMKHIQEHWKNISTTAKV